MGNKKILLIIAPLLIIGILLYFLKPKPLQVAEISSATTQISGVTATASNFYAGFPHSNVVDNNPSTLWNSGGNSPQWIMLDLQSPYTINQLQLIVSQTPNGRALHQIDAGPSPTNLTTIFNLDQYLNEGETVTIPLITPIPNIRYIKISAQGGNSWVSWRDIKVFAGNTPAPNSLRYYGYLSYDGLIPTMGASYLSELDSLGNTNITWSSIGHIDEFASHNIQIIVTDLRHVFFDQVGKLYPDWEAKFANIKPMLTPRIDRIYGFYFDEPVWGNISATDFRMVTKLIRDTYPQTRIFVIEAAPPLRSNSIPANYFEYVTDLGLDYYFTMESSDNLNGWGEYLKLHENLKPHLVGKKLWLVPDGYGDNYARWYDAYERYLSLALTTDNAVGIVGFIYQWPQSNVALRSLLIPGQPQYDPNFRARQIEIGQAIIKNNPKTVPSPSPSLKPGDLNSDGKVNLVDFNLLIAKYGNPYTILDFNAIVSNYGK